MRTWAALAAVVAIVAAVGGYLGAGSSARAGVAAQDCEDWVDQTYERVQSARTLLYPSDRQDAFQGTAEQAAEELFVIGEEQIASDPPEGGQQINDDLIEAMTEGAAGLAAGGEIGAAQYYFAKSIIYNADVRLLSLVETC